MSLPSSKETHLDSLDRLLLFFATPLKMLPSLFQELFHHGIEKYGPKGSGDVGFRPAILCCRHDHHHLAKSADWEQYRAEHEANCFGYSQIRIGRVNGKTSKAYRITHTPTGYCNQMLPAIARNQRCDDFLHAESRT